MDKLIVDGKVVERTDTVLIDPQKIDGGFIKLLIILIILMVIFLGIHFIGVSNLINSFEHTKAHFSSNVTYKLAYFVKHGTTEKIYVVYTPIKGKEEYPAVKTHTFYIRARLNDGAICSISGEYTVRIDEEHIVDIVSSIATYNRLNNIIMAQVKQRVLHHMSRFTTIDILNAGTDIKTTFNVPINISGISSSVSINKQRLYKGGTSSE